MQAVRNLAFDCPSNREGRRGEVCTGLTTVLVARGDTSKFPRTPSAQGTGRQRLRRRHRTVLLAEMGRGRK